MSRLAPPQDNPSLRTRRLSSVSEFPNPHQRQGAGPGLNPFPGRPSGRQHGSNRPPASSASSSLGPGPRDQPNTGGPRAQSNVGAKLLKKRQSVSYPNHHHGQIYAVGARGIGPGEVVPALPTLPQGMMLPTGAGQAAVVGSGGRSGPNQMMPSSLIPGGGLVGGTAPSHDGTLPDPSSRTPSPSNSKTQAQRKGTVNEGLAVDFETEQRLAMTGLDIDSFASERFKPEEFLKMNLDGSNETDETDELRALKAQLEGAMEITETELQKSVFKNYADFVVISKEIATLENEMLELKSVLEEWRAVPESLEGGWGEDDLLMGEEGDLFLHWRIGAKKEADLGRCCLLTGSGSASRRNQRNSLADLATLYKSQLAALWEGVEGSQKLLPYTPGRHIITETTSFVELNSATYKPKQSVHLFLLNDAMLVSVKKRRGTGVGGPTRLVAERCFSLSEIVVVDLKDGGDLTNAVKIKRGKETVIFRTDKTEDKKVLLMAFKKVAEELMNKKRKEMLSEAEARKGDFSSTLRGGARSGYDSGLTSNGFSPAQALGLGSGDSTGKDLAWIGDFSDEVSVAIAARMFEEATSFIEKGKGVIPHLTGDPHASAVFRAKLDARTTELVTALLNDLSDSSIRKLGVVRTTSWLLRLSQGERARETFLTARGVSVRKRARQIKFEGDISMYISELAMVTFTMIKNTCEWYMAAFKDNRMASGFVRWASEQVEIFAETFRRQVYGVDQDGKVIQESLEVTQAHGAMVRSVFVVSVQGVQGTDSFILASPPQLRDVGLDFTFLLDGLLRSTEEGPNDPSGTGGPLRPGPRRKPSGNKKSHVAMARQSIFLMQSTGSAGGGGGGKEGRAGSELGIPAELMST
ncbi:BZ3500_MvSof-1268-A1-R1_Chr6-3g08647 [Microbotryum saponariae]|uniref:Exocyst complex component EXO84 n=1 Tax=Microbotryum saponariae TaxID=289078 RepID=A0A2X0KJ16_9BASI|nr:BZ3500_MvSof-1268-A1-R1_Chr6-3g08647 [Microbotryum saponariae]SDA07248.1 BZ3501_MvSof-1269-A2-R1_Chr6-2g08350 [Microbotryum saponariae]